MRPKSSWLNSRTVKRVRKRHFDIDGEWEDEELDEEEEEEIPVTRRERVRRQLKSPRGRNLFDSTIGDVVEDVWADIDNGNFNPKGDDFLQTMGNIAAKGLALTVVVGVSTAASHAARALMGKLIAV